MLPIILVSALVLFGALFLIVAGRPSAFVITRTASVSAPAANVFAQVNDLHRWDAWSPWAKLDPAMRQTFDGPPAGTGAGYAWDGNRKVGAGRMTIAESRAPELVRLRLEFLRPFATTNAAEFTFRASGSQTTVTWSMSGRGGFITKLFGLVMDMDKLIGRDFEKGLAQLKAVAESSVGR